MGFLIQQDTNCMLQRMGMEFCFMYACGSSVLLHELIDPLTREQKEAAGVLLRKLQQRRLVKQHIRCNLECMQSGLAFLQPLYRKLSITDICAFDGESFRNSETA